MQKRVDSRESAEQPQKKDTPADNAKHRLSFLSVILFLISIVVLMLLTCFIPAQSFWLLQTLENHFAAGPFSNMLHALIPASQAAASESNMSQPFMTIMTARTTGLFIAGFCLLFLIYFLALAYLPARITSRYLLITTLVLGSAYILLPFVTSQDIFSYIAYARMEVLYHLNPLTTLPTVISKDEVFGYLYWTDQPSIYGPMWILLTGALQWLTLRAGFQHILAMQLVLRLLGLSMHLGSVWMIWLISGHLQRLQPSSVLIDTQQWQQRRLCATLAFAWNPFLLLEACVNAHCDTTMLFLVLVALWLLCHYVEGWSAACLWACLLLALAACLKITLAILMPGLLLFLWNRQVPLPWRSRKIGMLSAALGSYSAIVVLCYLPFWQQGELLHVLQITPASSRDINSIYEVMIRIYTHFSGTFVSSDLSQGSVIERLSHQFSVVVFMIIYVLVCIKCLRVSHYTSTLPTLIGWMAFIWLLYCVVGSPWFWPWYTTTFFGLIAVLGASYSPPAVVGPSSNVFDERNRTLFTRVLAVSLLSVYSFGWWAPEAGLPLFPHLRWMYLRGIWIWLPPFVTLYLVAYLWPWLSNWYRRQRESKRQISIE